MHNHIPNSTDFEVEQSITTLRLPVFCIENKPYIFIKVMNDSEKYRISMNSNFLKNYNLKFRILRDQSLTNFMNSLKPTHRNLLKKGNNSIDSNEIDKIINTSIFLKLPEREKFPIQKHTILLENDGKPGRTLIDKYQVNINNSKKNVIYIIERSYDSIKNISLTFISEEFDTIHEFLDAYADKLNS